METVLGVASALSAALSFGSFGVPIKSRAVLAAKAHPVVIQCYKSAVCFSTAWLVLLFADLRFTWWGTVGAMIWVVNGIAAIIAIQSAGLGLSQCLWSGITIFVSFVWGAFIFQEPVRNVPLALIGLCIMGCGIAGVGYAATRTAPLGPSHASLEENGKGHDKEPGGLEKGCLPTPAAVSPSSHDPEPDQERLLSDAGSRSDSGVSRAATPDEEEAGSVAAGDEAEAVALNVKVLTAEELGLEVPSRVFVRGVLCAVYVGIANGSFMAPLKYAPNDVKGAEYLVSFGIGAALVTGLVAGGFFLYLKQTDRPFPSFHVRAAGGPLCCAGLLWSTGNFFSIYATLYLGMAIGWPLVQCQLVVSGCWGIMHYREVTDPVAVRVFAISTGVILIGVFFLAWFGL